MADKSKLSTVLAFGGKILPSAKASTTELEKRVGRVGKTIGKLEAAQKSLRKEMRSAPKGEQYDAMARRAEVLKARIASVRAEAERLERATKGRERLSGMLGGARDAAEGFARAGLATIGTAAVAAAGGILLLSHHTAEHGREMQLLSRRTGLSTRQLEVFGFAARRTGVELDTVVDATKTLNEKIAEAMRDRRGGSADMLRRLGLRASVLGSLHPDEQLAAVADAMQGVTNQAERTRVATELLGGSGDRLLPMLAGGSEGLRAFARDAEAAGLIISGESQESIDAYNHALEDLRERLTGMGRRIGIAALPAMTQMLGTVRGFLSRLDVDAIANRIGSAFREVGRLIDKHGDDMLRVASDFGGLLLDAVPPALDLAEAVLDVVGAVGGAETVVKGLGLAWAGAMGVTTVGKIRAVIGVVRDLSGLVGPGTGLGGQISALGPAAVRTLASIEGGLVGVSGVLLPMLAGLGAMVGMVGIGVGLAAAVTRDQDANRERERRERLRGATSARLAEGDFGADTMAMLQEERNLVRGSFDERFAQRRGARSFIPAGLEAAPASGAIDRSNLPTELARGNARAGGRASTVNNNQRVTVNQTINAAPGMSPEDVANAADAQLRRSIEDQINGSFAP